MRRTALAAVMIILLITACQSSESRRNAPAKAAKEWTDALLKMDENQLAARTCAAQQPNLQKTSLWLSGIVLLEQQFIDQDIKTDTSRVRYDMTYNDAAVAQVHVYGELRISIMKVSRAVPLNTFYTMIFEDKKWKWCGEARISSPAPAAPTPTPS